MADFEHGSVATLSIGGTPVSEYLESINADLERQTAEVNPLGNSWRKTLPGQRSLSGSCSGYFHPTFDALIYNAWEAGTAVAFVYRPQGDGVGLPEYTGDLKISNYRIVTSSTDAGRASFDFGSDGEIQRGVQQ